MTLAEYVSQMKQRHLDTFKSHKIFESSDRRFLVGRAYPDGKMQGFYAYEVISLHNGRLFIGGDIEDCIYGYYCGSDGVGDRARWIGRCDDMHYVVEKARIGLDRGSQLVYTYAAEVAVTDLPALVSESEYEQLTENVMKDCMTLARFGSFNQLQRRLMSVGVDPEDAYDVGKVPSSRVFSTWAALRRLSELLDERASGGLSLVP